jgi:hypothetical protein
MPASGRSRQLPSPVWIVDFAFSGQKFGRAVIDAGHDDLGHGRKEARNLENRDLLVVPVRTDRADHPVIVKARGDKLRRSAEHLGSASQLRALSVLAFFFDEVICLSNRCDRIGQMTAEKLRRNRIHRGLNGCTLSVDETAFVDDSRKCARGRREDLNESPLELIQSPVLLVVAYGLAEIGIVEQLPGWGCMELVGTKFLWDLFGDAEDNPAVRVADRHPRGAAPILLGYGRRTDIELEIRGSLRHAKHLPAEARVVGDFVNQ